MASKITIKRSLTAAAPAGLSFGEMALVQGSGLTANQLYVGISGGNPVWVGAQIGTTGTWTDNAAQTSLATQYAIEQRITSKISANTAGVSSFNGLTGAVTGVSSFNGLTGAVSGVTTSVANTFTAVNTFSAGITVSGGNLNAININTTGSVSINNTPATLTTTTAGNATVFNSVATSLGIGGAATAITMGAQSGTINLRNPTIIVGGADNTGVATITTVSSGNTLSVSPYGSFSISPTSTTSAGGSRTSLIVTNPDDALGTVLIRGGDLYLGTKTNSLESTTPVNIVFEGATDNGFETTITVTDPATADRTITLPDATGTVALTTTSVASVVAGTGISVSGATGAVTITNIGVQSFNGATGAVTGVSSFNGLTGAVGGVTTSVANTFTALQTFSAGISTSGGTFGTPTQLVGTNITGTASGLTAGNVTTNANLTGAITSTGNATVLGTSSFSSANLLSALSDKTGSGLNVFGTSPTISNSLIAGGVSFDLLNTTATTVNFAGAATTLNLGVIGGTATFAGSVVVNGDFTVQGNTTTLNTTTLNVEDFNITMGLTLNSASLSTGAGIAIGTGTGISFAYEHSSTSWLSTVDLNVLSGKSYKIGGTTVLNSSALGAGITGSSLTQVGTITSGTWNSSFAAGIISNNDINASAGIVDTKLATIATAGKVSNSATTATSANTASAIVARDASGGFTAGTITAALTGNASTATTATTATNVVATEQTSGTIFLVGVASASASTGLLVNATPSTALTYDVTSGELSATLIDGGTF